MTITLLPDTPVLKAEGLGRIFGATPALADLDLSVSAGEVVCLLGGNGAGKTTTLGLFLGFLSPTAGAARVMGRSVHDDIPAARAHLGYVPEIVALYPTLSGIETLQYFNDLAGRPPLSNCAARDLLCTAGLEGDRASKRIATYSKGMRQKVGLAIALAKQAAALLLDEPLSGLDPAAANDLVERIKALARNGTAVLMATHDIFRAHDVADRLCVMRAGRLVETVDARSLSASAAEALYLAHMRAQA
ncbi:ABC transporter ATP-binding protein [uncultured Sphingomonas sp.]|uniref:ABC transporter ATP-binding protein n=1 Tax=uncultured Sphingomonas sp. TaxID=158754 RepID=UPI0035CB7057